MCVVWYKLVKKIQWRFVAYAVWAWMCYMTVCTNREHDLKSNIRTRIWDVSLYSYFFFSYKWPHSKFKCSVEFTTILTRCSFPWKYDKFDWIELNWSQISQYVIYRWQFGIRWNLYRNLCSVTKCQTDQIELVWSME